MSVVRRRTAAAGAVAGLVLLGGPAWAQEDPCAPGPDGSVPEMCQSGPSQSDTGTVGMQPEDPCAGSRPVEPGDGVVTDGGDQGAAAGEPGPDAPPQEEPERTDPESADPATPESSGEAEDGVVCAFAVPVSAPGAGAPESAVGRGAAVGAQLPRTGPYDRLLALAAVGSGLVVAGAGAAAAGRRHRTS